MVWPAIGLGLAQAGLGFWQSKSASDRQNEQAREAFKLQNQQNFARRAFENLQIRKQNEYTKLAYETKLDIYGKQLAFNQDAANRAYEATQINTNRAFTQMAFQRQDLDAQLLEAVGANAASIEGENRSARLFAAKRTYGRYGAQSAQLAASARDMISNRDMQMEDIGREHYGADLRAWGNVAIAPYMQSELPPAMMQSMPQRQGNTALMIGSALMGGLSTYNQFAPSDAKIGNWFKKKDP